MQWQRLCSESLNHWSLDLSLQWPSNSRPVPSVTHERLCPLQTMAPWLASANLIICKTNFIILLQIPPPALSLDISVDSTIIYLFTQVIFIISLGKWALYLEDNLKSNAYQKMHPFLHLNSLSFFRPLLSLTWVTIRIPPPNFIEI